MPEKVNPIPEDKIIEIQSYGDVTVNDIMQSNRLLEYYYMTENYRKLLVDAKEHKSAPHIDDILSVFSHKLPGMRVAVIPSIYRDIRSDIQGIIDFRTNNTLEYFNSAEAAIDWLKHKD